MSFVRLKIYTFYNILTEVKTNAVFINNNSVGERLPKYRFKELTDYLKSKIPKSERRLDQFVHNGNQCWAYYKTPEEITKLITDFDYRIIIEGIDEVKNDSISKYSDKDNNQDKII